MRWYQTAFFSGLIAITLFCVLNPPVARAQFQPPDQITLAMYRLAQGSGALVRDPATQEPIPCTTGDTSYGCTADSAKPYPFGTGTITIGIDGTSGSDNAFYPYPYLWDVVTEEYGLQLGSGGNKPLAGVQAQAIAARTYLYQRIQDRDLYTPPLVVDNSARFHVFLPYAYATLSRRVIAGPHLPSTWLTPVA